MATTKRQSIMAAVKTRLESITVANGYDFNLGSHVYEWRTATLNDNEIPGIVFRDVQNVKIEGGPIAYFRWGLNIEIDIITQGGTSITDIRKMIGDVYKAIGTDHRWSGLAILTEQPNMDEIQSEQQEKKIAGAVIRLQIIYDTLVWET
ncbi:MAG: hypothetical protein HY096_00325 [Nitrospinae bacterium]|nr:hypothetical protein [Nitrospinota bacterium]